MAKQSKSERTRARLVAAAAELFGAQPFDSVSTRAVARQAGVDAALIHHYFGSKEGLFEAVMQSSVDVTTVASRVSEQPRQDWGCALVRELERVWCSPAAPALRAVLRRCLSSNHNPLKAFVSHAIMPAIMKHLDCPEPEARLRATLTGSQLVGLILARHVVGLEPLASLPSDDVVALVGPALQRYLTGDLAQP